jgi:hypothetical protein
MPVNIYDLRFQVKCHPDTNVRDGNQPYVRAEHEAHAYLPVSPPGAQQVVEINLPTQSTGEVTSLDVYFVDQRNTQWRRDAVTGHLSKASNKPFTVKTVFQEAPGYPPEEDGSIPVQWLDVAAGRVDE